METTISPEQLEKLRFPIGKFNPDAADANLEHYIDQIAALPGLMRQAVQNLTDEQLNTPYRPGGWTVRQVVHHVADSHINSYIRFKLALTEDNPTIKPYEEDRWAELADGKFEPVEVSLLLLQTLHHRWVVMLKSLTPNQWQRTYLHPVSGEATLTKVAALYAWHGNHHLAHITNLSSSKNW